MEGRDGSPSLGPPSRCSLRRAGEATLPPNLDTSAAVRRRDPLDFACSLCRAEISI
jgi:hypothetical protein